MSQTWKPLEAAIEFYDVNEQISIRIEPGGDRIDFEFKGKTGSITIVDNDGRGLRLCESALGPKADWSQAPEWAQWWACDASGTSDWYEQEPVCYETISYCGWDRPCIEGIRQGLVKFARAIEIPIGIDWRTLIERRPQEANIADQIS